MGAISPWNAPLVLGIRSIAIPLAVGNTVVMKPSEDAPITCGLLLADVLAEAGFPAGVLNVVTNDLADAGDVVAALIADPRVRMVNFTGSTNVGPAVVIYPVDSTEAAIDMANDTEYGLTGGVISRDLNAALDVVSRVRSGIIHINDQGIGDEPMAPFGGVKNSGYGKFGGTAGIESFTEQRWVTIQHSGRPTYPF